MTRPLTKKQIIGVKKALSYDHIRAKALRKKKRAEKAAQQKSERHKSKMQKIEELIDEQLALERESDDDR